MKVDISNLGTTIVPKSDQLNAEQLLQGPITITITQVRAGSTPEQPIKIHYEGEDGRPYLPCKTCRKVLILGWGPDGNQWAGRQLTLYCDPEVAFGGSKVGGIRISHMTDIAQPINVNLTATRGKKALHRIERMERAKAAPAAPAFDWTPDDLERLKKQAAQGQDAADMGKKEAWWKEVPNKKELTAYIERQKAA